MINELLFIGYVLTVSTASFIAVILGKEYLMSLISAMAVLANLFVMKQIILFGFTATASDALAVGITLGLNLLQEYYQKQAAIKAIWIGFYCAVFYSIMSMLHLAYVSAPGDTMDPVYHIILESVPRTVGASLVTFLIVQFVDTHLYGILKSLFNGRFFVLRNYGTLALTQLLDTILFSFLGLYKLNEAFSDLSVIIDIIKISYIIKLMVILISVPYIRLAKFFRPVSP